MSLFWNSISIKEKAHFYENVANLLEGGVTLISALKGIQSRLREGTTMRESIDNLLFYVEWGDNINVAMRKLPHFFSDQEIAIVESGESTGMLQTSFLSIAKDLRMQEELRNKIIGAMTYPVIIMIFLAIAFTVVMVYVIPQLLPLLSGGDTKLPWTTQSLIGTSNFLRANVLYVVASLISFSLIFVGYTRTPSGEYWWDQKKLFLPLTGEVYKNYLIVRSMLTFYLLSSSGVSIIKTLTLTGVSSGNKVLESLYRQLTEDTSSGKKISASMRERDPLNVFFTPDILQMIESAEKTSTIGPVTEKIATQYRREVDNALATLVKFIEPIALLLAGVFVLWFAVAIFSAIMQIVTVAWE